nr:hypothetical protein [Tanacetum cinerariifolium]
MDEPLSPDRVFDFPMDELEPHLAYDFFVPGPLPRYADELMVGMLVDEIAEPIVEAEEQVISPVIDMEEDIAMLFGEGDFSDDDSEGFKDEEKVWEVTEEWLMAPVTPPPMPNVPSLSTYEVGGPSIAAAEGQSFTLPTPRFPVPPSVVEDLSTRMGTSYGVPDGSNSGKTRARWCSGGAGSANYDLERRGDYLIDPAGTGFAGSCAAKRFTDLAAADYGF